MPSSGKLTEHGRAQVDVDVHIVTCRPNGDTSSHASVGHPGIATSGLVNDNNGPGVLEDGILQFVVESYGVTGSTWARLLTPSGVRRVVSDHERVAGAACGHPAGPPSLPGSTGSSLTVTGLVAVPGPLWVWPHRSTPGIIRGLGARPSSGAGRSRLRTGAVLASALRPRWGLTPHESGKWPRTPGWLTFGEASKSKTPGLLTSSVGWNGCVRLAYSCLCGDSAFLGSGRNLHGSSTCCHHENVSWHPIRSLRSQ